MYSKSYIYIKRGVKSQYYLQQNQVGSNNELVVWHRYLPVEFLTKGVTLGLEALGLSLQVLIFDSTFFGPDENLLGFLWTSTLSLIRDFSLGGRVNRFFFFLVKAFFFCLGVVFRCFVKEGFFMALGDMLGES